MKTSPDSYPLVLPSGVDLTLPALELGGRKAEDRLACILHQIVVRSHHLRNTTKQWNGYTEVPSAALSALVGPKFAAPAMRSLVKHGILQRQIGSNGKHSYRVPTAHSTGFCKAYRLAPTLQQLPYAFRPLRDAVLIRKLRRSDAEKNEQAIGNSSVHAAIFRNLSLVSLPAGPLLPVGHEGSAVSQSFHAHQLSAHEVLSKHFWIRETRSTGRLSHNVTVMPRELRRRLMLAGEAPAEVDMKNAQPFFLLSLYHPHNPERDLFARVVSRGEFYETLLLAMDAPEKAKWGTAPDAWKSQPELRDAFKKHVLTHVLYGSLTTESGQPTKPQHVFQALARPFPFLQAQLTRRRQTKEDTSRLAIEMQRHEATLVLRHVFPRILSELPDCAAISIHDAVLCQGRFAPAVAAIFKEEAQRIYGVAPSIKTSYAPPEPQSTAGGVIAA